MLLPCADAPANLIKTKICRVCVPCNVITQENVEVIWLRALSVTLQYVEVTPFSSERITNINNRPRTVLLAVNK